MFLCDIGKDDNRFLTFPILPRIIAIDMRNDYQIQPSNGISDEKLCRLARQGDGPAMENLIRRYTRLVKTCARPYFLAGADAEDLMQEIDDAIGRDKSTYRVAHLGISPAPALMHGFYTVDGYSNNYPLEYKHRFREVIAPEIEKNEEVRVYFDTWGNRCYLFNSITGNYMRLQKGNTLVYEGLEFDMEALRELGCEYLFSGAEIGDADRMSMELVGYFETEDSYWGIWVYRL